MAITGRCFCGAVTFTCDEPPVMTRTCWCRDCRYLASGNATVNAVFKAEGVKVKVRSANTGAPPTAVMPCAAVFVRDAEPRFSVQPIAVPIS